MSWSFTGLGVSYYLVRGSAWGQILLSHSKAMKIKELNNLLLCFVEIQFYDLLIRWCHESCFYESQFFLPTNLLLVLISSKKDLLSENERILKNAKSAKATNFFYQKAKINNSGFMKTRFKKAFHEQIKIYRPKL